MGLKFGTLMPCSRAHVRPCCLSCGHIRLQAALKHQQSKRQFSMHAVGHLDSTRQIQCDVSAPAALQLPLLLCTRGPEHCQGLPLCVAGKAEPLVTEVETWIMFVVWWVGLGVLSSVGLGTGIHTGLLFLFPHILKVSAPVQLPLWHQSSPGAAPGHDAE